MTCHGPLGGYFFSREECEGLCKHLNLEYEVFPELEQPIKVLANISQFFSDSKSHLDGRWFIHREGKYLHHDGKWKDSIEPRDQLIGYFFTKEECEALCKSLDVDYCVKTRK